MTDKILDKIPNITYICAPPESGKSYLLHYLLNELFKLKKLKYGIVFSGSKYNGDFNFLPQEYIYSHYDENVVKKLYNIQVKAIKDSTTKTKRGTAPPAFIIFDDMIGSINFNSKFMRKLITNYRHPNFTLLFTTQYVKALPPLLRTCTSFFVTFRVIGKKSIEAIQESFMPEKTTKEVDEYISGNLKSVEDHNFIVVNLKKNIDNKYSIDRAPAEYKQIKINY